MKRTLVSILAIGAAFFVHQEVSYRLALKGLNHSPVGDLVARQLAREYEKSSPVIRILDRGRYNAWKDYLSRPVSEQE
ncbi:MAG TPA: hypothetical protein VJK03_01875 [Candidatus Nanoarchaeia archaeon]|nr:hypothetical protein [Candidatus Nanoarchaeia archaeon]